MGLENLNLDDMEEFAEHCITMCDKLTKTVRGSGSNSVVEVVGEHSYEEDDMQEDDDDDDDDDDTEDDDDEGLYVSERIP